MGTKILTSFHVIHFLFILFYFLAEQSTFQGSMYSKTDTSDSAFTLFLYAFVRVNVSNKCSFLCTCKIMNNEYPFDLILHVHHTLCMPRCCCYIPTSWICFTNSRLGLVARQSNLICLELCSIFHTAKRVQLDASTISCWGVKGALKTI